MAKFLFIPKTITVVSLLCLITALCSLSGISPSQLGVVPSFDETFSWFACMFVMLYKYKSNDEVSEWLGLGGSLYMIPCYLTTLRDHPRLAELLLAGNKSPLLGWSPIFFAVAWGITTYIYQSYYIGTAFSLAAIVSLNYIVFGDIPTKFNDMGVLLFLTIILVSVCWRLTKYHENSRLRFLEAPVFYLCLIIYCLFIIVLSFGPMDENMPLYKFLWKITDQSPHKHMLWKVIGAASFVGFMLLSKCKNLHEIKKIVWISLMFFGMARLIEGPLLGLAWQHQLLVCGGYALCFSLPLQYFPDLFWEAKCENLHQEQQGERNVIIRI